MQCRLTVASKVSTQQSCRNKINETIDYEAIEGIEREVTRMNELRIESADKNIPGKNKNQSK